MLRRQKFLEAMNNPVNPPTQNSTNMTSMISCELCDFVANSKEGLEIHMVRKHKNFDQLDGNISLDTTFETANINKTIQPSPARKGGPFINEFTHSGEE